MRKGWFNLNQTHQQVVLKSFKNCYLVGFNQSNSDMKTEINVLTLHSVDRELYGVSKRCFVNSIPPDHAFI